MDIGSFLKSKRNQANLSLSQVGDILGYSSQAVYSWESNKALPELAVWSKYANILGSDYGNTEITFPENAVDFTITD